MTNIVSRLLQKLPDFRGKVRLGRSFRGKLHGPGSVRDTLGFVYDVPDVTEPIAFHLLLNGTYEKNVSDLLRRQLRLGGVLIDVGANIGVFTIPMASHVGPEGRVVAIEASPEIFKTLRHNVERNEIGNVELIEAAACANEDGTQFYPAPADHFGMGSLAPQFDSKAIKVRSVTLDRLAETLNLPRIDAIKIDVEGFELEVLKGAVGILEGRRPPLIVFEFCEWAEERAALGSAGAAQHWLVDLGYKIWRVEDYARRDALKTPLTRGTAMLVAQSLKSR